MVASPGGREVGRVSVRVLPDTSRFGAELAADLRKFEAALKVEIPTALDTSGAEHDLKELQATLKRQANAVKIPVQVSRDQAREQVRKATTNLQGQAAKVKVVADPTDFRKGVLAEARRLGQQTSLTIPATIEGERLRRQVADAVREVEKHATVDLPLYLPSAAILRRKLDDAINSVRDIARDHGVKVAVDPVAEPDSFQRSVLREVQRVGRAAELKIPTTADGESLRRDLAAKIAEVEALSHADVPVGVKEAATFRADLLKLVAEVESVARIADPTIKVRVDTGRSKSAVDDLTRGVFKLINGLGGLTQVRLRQLGTVGQQLALISSRFIAYTAILGPLLVVAAAGALAVGPALATTLPILGALGAGIGVVALGFSSLFGDKVTTAEGQKRTGGVFKSLNQQVSLLRLNIGALLAAGLDPLVQRLSQTTFPAFTQGLQGVAVAVNAGIRQFLVFAASAEAAANTRLLFAGFQRSLLTLDVAVQPLTRAFLTLSVAALPGMQLLGQAFADVAVRFSNFIQQINASGQLSAVITRAVTDTLSFLGAVGQISGALLDVLGALEPLARSVFAAVGSAVLALLQGLASFIQGFDLSSSVFEPFLAGLAILAAQLRGLGPLLFTALEALTSQPQFEPFLAAVARLLLSVSQLLADVLDLAGRMLVAVIQLASGPLLGFLTTTADALSTLTQFLDQHLEVLGIVAALYAGVLFKGLAETTLVTERLVPAIGALSTAFAALRVEIAAVPPVPFSTTFAGRGLIAARDGITGLGRAIGSLATGGFIRATLAASAMSDSLKLLTKVSLANLDLQLRGVGVSATAGLLRAQTAALGLTNALRTFGVGAVAQAGLDALLVRLSAAGTAVRVFAGNLARPLVAPFVAAMRAVDQALLGLSARLSATIGMVDNFGFTLTRQVVGASIEARMAAIGTALRTLGSAALDAARGGLVAVGTALRAFAASAATGARAAIAALVTQLRTLAVAAGQAAVGALSSLAVTFRAFTLGTITALGAGVKNLVASFRALAATLLTVETVATVGLALIAAVIIGQMQGSADAAQRAHEAFQQFSDGVAFDANHVATAGPKLQQFQDHMTGAADALNDYVKNRGTFGRLVDNIPFLGNHKFDELKTGVDDATEAFNKNAKAQNNVQTNLADLSRRTGLTKQSLGSLAEQLGVDFTGPFAQNAEGRKKILDYLDDLATKAGLTSGIIKQVAGDDAAAIEAFSKDVEAYVQKVQQAFATDTDVLGKFGSNQAKDTKSVAAAREAVAKATKNLAAAQAKAGAQGTAVVKGINSGTRAHRANVAAVTAVQKAQDRLTEANKKLSAAQGAQASHDLQASYKATISLVQRFNADLDTAVRRGLDPDVVAKLMAEGPVKAAPVLRAIVSDSTGATLKVVNEGEATLKSFNDIALAQARIVQIAIHAPTDALQREAGRARQIASEAIAGGGDVDSKTIAKKLGMSRADVRKIAQDFGITLADQTAATTADLTIKADVTIDGKVVKLTLYNDPTLNLPALDYTNVPRDARPGGHGGPSKPFARGGLVLGPGGPTADLIAARLSNREFVQPFKAVDFYGVDVMRALQHRRIPKEALRALMFGGHAVASSLAAASVPRPAPAPIAAVRVSTEALQAVSGPDTAAPAGPRHLTVIDHDGVFRGQMRIAAIRSQRDRDKAAHLARLGTWGTR